MNRHEKRLLLAVAWLLLAAAFAAADEPSNPLFEQLRDAGLSVTSETKISLPPPLMADGLDTATQQEVLRKIAGKRFTVKTFAGKIGTAPHVYGIRKIAAAGDDAPRVYGVDVSFVAHGSLDIVAGKNFLAGLHEKRKDRAIHLLTEEEMKKRELGRQSGEHRQERYSHGVFVVLDRVELRAALHTIATRRPNSLFAATRIDPRFAKDADFPNQWRKIAIDEEGRRKFGPARPYAGAGGYLKITRLHEPKGALFVESHLIYTEPKGWFNGADPLRPKLPAIIQSEVRTFRRELKKVEK